MLSSTLLIMNVIQSHPWKIKRDIHRRSVLCLRSHDIGTHEGKKRDYEKYNFLTATNKFKDSE